ncbi:kinase-like domain-containing protein [Xylariaceae sp. FL1019]|nr:kinase-like domain-containing protein [Xylariaceae sp. FL1019]
MGSHSAIKTATGTDKINELGDELECKSKVTHAGEEREKIPGLLKKDVQHQKYDWMAGDPYEPCATCKWSPFLAHFYNKYKSNHKLFYVCQTNAVWSLGGEVILKDRPFEAVNAEADNMRFLSGKTTLPIPRVFHDWTDKDGIYHILMERTEGDTLESMWDKLDAETHEKLAKQTAEFLIQFRSIQSDKIQNVNGQPCNDNGLVPAGSEVLPIMSNDDEVWAAIEKVLAEVDQPLKEKIRRAMPPTKPYTFTHGDLSICNIMVKDGNLSGLIDFEYSGYYPCWWEYARNAMGFTEADRVWKDLLYKYMEPHCESNEQGRRWWRACWGLARQPKDESTKKKLEELFDEQ